MTTPTPNNSFEFSHLAQQVDQFTKSPDRFELAPSMEELLRRVAIVKGWIVEKKLKPDEVPTAERWLQYVEERAEVDAVTKKTIQDLRAGMAFSKMNPKERFDKVIAEFLQDADNPKKFNEFIEAFIQERAQYSKEQAIIEFHRVWEIVIVQQGYSVKVEGNSVLVYDRNGVLDRERTASMAKLPDAVSIYRKQQEFARARVEAEYKSPKDRVLATINAYNRKARGKKLPVLPALTPAILANEGARNIYINDVMNSGMSEEEKAIVVDYLKSPAEAEAIYLEAKKAAGKERGHIVAAKTEVDRLAQNAGVESGITAEDWYHPEKVIGKVISGMGVWIAPASLYLILNLFGVSHDSLLMKLLAGSTVIGVAKGTGAWKMIVDVAQGKNQTANEAVDWAKKQWDTSNENGVVKWVKDLVGDAAAAVKENLAYFSAWTAYSNYHAVYTEGGKSETRQLLKVPFDYIQGHIQAGNFDARFNKDQTTLRSKGSEYANFVSLMNALNAEGIKNYGEKRWKEVRANRSIAEVITIAYKNDAVPLGQSETPRPASSAGPAAAGVAAAASALAASSSDGATTVRDAVKTGGKLVSNVAGAAADTAVGAFEWLSATNEKEINGIKVRNMPRGLSVETSSDGNKLTLKFTPSLKEGGKDVKEYTIDDKTKDAYYAGFTLGTLSITIKVKGGVVEFMDSKVAEEDRRKTEQDAKAKLDKADYEKKLKGAHDARFSGANAKAVVEQIKSFSTQAKANKQKEVATGEEYQILLWEILSSSSQVKLGSIADYIFDRTSVSPPIGISLKDTMNQALFKRLLIVYILGDNTSIKKEDFLKRYEASLPLEKYIFPNK